MSGNNHGQTVAAWTLSIIVMLAFLVGSIGVVLDNRVVFWSGVALIGVGVIAGKVLANLGFGKKS
ncbi:MAG: hypothetical protein RLZZ571_988 [Actinomycetota bacterium]|jgi:hypothetical protein